MWAEILLRDTTMLSSYEEYARESALEANYHEDPSNPPRRRPRIAAHGTPTQHMRGGTQTTRRKGRRTTLDASDLLDPTAGGFIPEGLMFEDEQTETSTQNVADLSR